MADMAARLARPGFALLFTLSMAQLIVVLDAYGRARLYRIGLVTFVVASTAGGLAVEPGLLIASRVIQGIGAALLAPAGLSLLVTSYPDEQDRSRAPWAPTRPARCSAACAVDAALALD